MKRFITIILALTMLASVGSVAYAADEGSGSKTLTTDGASETISVSGKFQKTEDPNPVYSVKVEWESLKFTCTVNGKLIWNPSDHSYTNDRTVAWVKPSADEIKLNPNNDKSDKTRTVRVTNNSNADVYVKASAVKEDEDFGFGLTVSPGEVIPVENLSDTTTVVKNYEDFVVQIVSPTAPDKELRKSGTYTLGTVTITVSPTKSPSP